MTIPNDDATVTYANGPSQTLELSKNIQNLIGLDVMMHVDDDELRQLKQGFQRHDGELTLSQFVELMMKYTPPSETTSEIQVGLVPI